MTAGAHYGVGMDQVEPQRPVDVRTAYELWCAVAVLGVLASITLIFVTLGDRERYLDEVTRRVQEMQPAGGAESVDVTLAFNLGLGLAALVGVAVAGAVYFLARKLRSGKAWARLILVGATAMVTVMAISSFAAEKQSGVAPMAMEIIMILQAVLAVGATVLVHRREANLYFLARRKP